MSQRIAFLCLALFACDDGGARKSQPIGATGGTIASAGATLVVPSGAVEAVTDFTIDTHAASAPPSGATPVAPVYTFGPEGAQFGAPVLVTLAVELDKLPAGKTLADVHIYTAPAGSGSYTMLATTVVDATHVRAATSHFSDFAAAVVAGAVETPADLATRADLGAAPGDLAAAPADAGPTSCTPSCTQSGTSPYFSCSCSATCNGKRYALDCTPSTAHPGQEDCRCSVDGQSLPGPTLSSCDPSVTLNAYTTQCKF